MDKPLDRQGDRVLNVGITHIYRNSLPAGDAVSSFYPRRSLVGTDVGRRARSERKTYSADRVADLAARGEICNLCYEGWLGVLSPTLLNG